MKDFELLGQFYLGRVCDPATGAGTDELLLYDSKDLTTHAVIVGMTGSGKTGLGIGLLEEAAIDGVPSIVIDPKGDLGNLLLAFPELQAGDFKPWVDPTEAAQAGQTPDQAAAAAAAAWKDGLSKWGQDGARIARYRSAAQATIYTPGSNAGVPISVLRSFDAPPREVLDDPESFRERVSAAASGVLALLQIDADPMRSREHMLLANLFARTWQDGGGLDLGGLVHLIQKPPFEKIGVLDLESAFPAKERFALAMALNGVLASPAFSAWAAGEPLDVGRLLWTPEGRPRISILSIAHLGDAERMFFVTTLLNAVIGWMRAQPGTSSLRAILYMDEVFGFFPPSANPPSKTPMLTLLKQARAYGLGVVLATQNPVDLDYKGLGNAGTWFLGRLQTERDKLRVLDGLEGVSAAASRDFDRARMDKLLSGLRKRVFLMSNAHESAPVLFETRWALSYLRGPLTRAQIQTLTAAAKSSAAHPAPAGTRGVASAPGVAPRPISAGAPGPGAAPPSARPAVAATAGTRPTIPPGITECFLPPAPTAGRTGRIEYRPAILGAAKVHYVDRKAGIDEWETLGVLAPVPDGLALDPWAEARVIEGGVPQTRKEPEAQATFADVSGAALKPKSYDKWAKALKDHLYRTRVRSVWGCPALEAVSRPGEREGDFRARIALLARERRDGAVDEIRRRYAARVTAIEDRIRTAEGRVAREQAQVSEARWQTASSWGSAILGVLFGRKVMGGSTSAKASRAARDLGRASRESGDAARAAENLAALRQREADLAAEIEAEIARMHGAGDPARIEVTEIRIAPRKSDLAIGEVLLAWDPG